MNFRFNINMTDNDYLEFNKFHLLKSSYGRKNDLGTRIFIAVFMVIVCIALLFMGDFSHDSFIEILPLIFLLVIVEVSYTKLTELWLKHFIGKMKKKGKMPFSSSSVLEFGEDTIVETTETEKTEQKYSAVEKIYNNGGNIIYIYVNNTRAYLLPVSSFESEKEYKEFFRFLKEKTGLEIKEVR